MTQIIGIDFVTTESCAAFREGGEPGVIANPEGGRTTSSILSTAENGERLAGQNAKRQAVTKPENTLYIPTIGRMDSISSMLFTMMLRKSPRASSESISSCSSSGVKAPRISSERPALWTF